MQNKEDLDINAFFSTMKAIDDKKSIPSVHLLPEKRFPVWKYMTGMGIAASILLAIYLTPTSKKEEGLSKDTVIIKLVEIDNGQQEFHIETASSIDIWESPTNELLDLETP
jgi:hypothetical protein